MSRWRCAAMAGILAFQVLPAALAQDGAGAAAPAREVDPEARALIDRFREAIKQLRNLSCTIEQRSTEGTEPGELQTGSVVLTFERAPNGVGMIKKYRIAHSAPGAPRDGGKGAPESGTVWAFDGEAAFRLDHEAKTFASADSDAQAYPVAGAAAVIPTWSQRDVLMSPGAKLVAAKLLPDAEQEGVPCRVVEYTVELPMPPADEDEKPAPGQEPRLIVRQVRHVGAADLLPRRIQSWRSYIGRDDQKPGSFLGIYREVRANTSPASETFTLKPAAGYKEVAALPSELGIPGGEPPPLKFAAGDAAPAFSLKDADGKEVTLASLKGRVVLLDFWATWCGPCKAAMPKVQALHEKYAGKPVSVFGVNTWERAAEGAPRKYMEKQHYTYGLLMKGDELAKAYGISGIPTFVLIGPDGKVLYTGVGLQPGAEEKMAELIDATLASR